MVAKELGIPTLEPQTAKIAEALTIGGSYLVGSIFPLIAYLVFPVPAAVSLSHGYFSAERLLTIVKYPAASARPPGFVRKGSGGDYHATMCAAPAGYYARLGRS
jgi:hypothetical protein